MWKLWPLWKQSSSRPSFEMFCPHVFPMHHTLATSTTKQKSRTNCLQVQLSMFTHMLYLPPPPEGNLGFWDQKQGNQRNSLRRRRKDFIFPGRRACCILIGVVACCNCHLLHCTSPDQEYLHTWHMPMGGPSPSEAHCNTVVTRGGVTASTFGKTANPAVTLGESWELWTWASALHYKVQSTGKTSSSHSSPLCAQAQSTDRLMSLWRLHY